MGHASLKAIALVVRQHNVGAATVMTSSAEEKAFLRVAVAAIPRVAEPILAFPPDDRAGALETAKRRFLTFDYDLPAELFIPKRIEARRIAVSIANLPELLQRPRY
jgi:hypothetical protein